MNHATAWPLLDHFLEDTLEPETRSAVAAHLAGCETCQAYLAERDEMRAFMRDRLSRVTVPEGLAGRIQTAIQAAETAPVPIRRPRLWPIALVVANLAALLLLALGWWFLSFPARSPDLAAELAIPHLLFARDDTLLEVKGTPAAIRAWFKDKVSFPVMTPDLPDYTLHGGRLVAVNGQRAAQLIYENEQTEQYLSLLYFGPSLLEASHLKPAGRFQVGQYGDTAIVAWAGDQAGMALVANQPAADLLQLAAQTGNK